MAAWSSMLVANAIAIAIFFAIIAAAVYADDAESSGSGGGGGGGGYGGSDYHRKDCGRHGYSYHDKVTNSYRCACTEDFYWNGYGCVKRAPQKAVTNNECNKKCVKGHIKQFCHTVPIKEIRRRDDKDDKDRDHKDDKDRDRKDDKDRGRGRDRDHDDRDYDRDYDDRDDDYDRDEDHEEEDYEDDEEDYEGHGDNEDDEEDYKKRSGLHAPQPSPPQPSAPIPEVQEQPVKKIIKVIKENKTVCVEKCVCERGWFGRKCNIKRVQRTSFLNFGKKKGFKCSKKVHIKARCIRFKKHFGRKRHGKKKDWDWDWDSKHGHEHDFGYDRDHYKKDKIPTALGNNPKKSAQTQQEQKK